MEGQHGQSQDPAPPQDGPEDRSADTTGEAGLPTAPSPPVASQYPTTEPPGTILDNLNAALQDADATAAQSQQASQELQADLDELQREYDDLGKAVEGYANARASLTQQLDERRDYIEGKRQLISNAIDDQRDEVDQAWEAFDTRLKDLEQKRTQRWDELVKAEEERGKAERGRDQARQTFEELAGRQAVLTEQLKRLGDLKTGIEAADNDAPGMYVRLKEHDREFAEAEVALTSVDEYRKDLEEAWSELEQAKTALRKANLDATSAQNRFDLAKAEFERLQPQRVDEVLKRLPTPGRAGDQAVPSGA